MKPNTNPYRVESVDRAMVLLSLLVSRDELSATEAAQELGVATSTAHRILTTMCDRGFVTQCAKRLYHPGPELLRPRASWVSHQVLASRLRPVIESLFATVDETVHLMTLVGADARFIDGVESTRSLRVGLRTGMTLPAYCTSGGKAMLAALDHDMVESLHANGLRPWPGHPSPSLPALMRELTRTRSTGLGHNIEESEPGVAALGVAVPGPDGSPLAGIAVAIPTARFNDEVGRQIGHRLLEIREPARRALIPGT